MGLVGPGPNASVYPHCDPSPAVKDRKAPQRSVFSCEVPSAARASSAAISKLGGALLVEDVVGALACERLTELKLTAGRERVWGPTTPCVLGSAGV